MAKSGRSRSVRRLFAALYPEPQLQGQLHGLALALAQELPGTHPVALESLHLTALFIGPWPESRLEAALESVEAATAGIRPFVLGGLELCVVPAAGPARLIAAGALDCPRELAELHRRLASRLAPKKGRPADFWPHLTLLRFNAPRALSRLPSAPDLPAIEFRAVSLVESHLASTGARHRRLATFALRSGGP